MAEYALKDHRLASSAFKRHEPSASSTHLHGIGVGVGDAFTTLKLAVIGVPLLPVPPLELHGVMTNV